MKRFILILLSIALILSLAACNGTKTPEENGGPDTVIGGGTYVPYKDYPHSGTVEGGNYPKGDEMVAWFDATVIGIQSGTILVESHAESFEGNCSSDQIYVSTKLYSGTQIACFEIGDEVRITYNGMIAESYPAQIFTVYSIAFLTVEDTSSDFYFSMTWGVFGISSYDSRTGKLVKTTDATHPEDYVTEYFLTDAERKEIRAILTELDIESLGEFDYDDFGLSDPHLSLSLTVKMGDIDKTVNIPEAEIGYDGGRTPKAKKLLSAIKAIRDILVNTDEWKALPDYEFYYD